jgi:pyridoxal phosphate enzyme (YggS family)
MLLYERGLTSMVESRLSEEDLHARLKGVRARIEDCARRAGRAPEDVKLIGVSKTHMPQIMRQALEAGLQDFGENRVQEAESKILELGRNSARWHLIGHLQANKARRAVRLFDVIHSLDSEELAGRLDRLCVEEGRERLPVLIQVDLSGEETKSGVAEEGLSGLVDKVTSCERLRLMGLMTLPPFFEDAEHVRPYFRRLRELRDSIWKGTDFGHDKGELSMGMSHDFEVAIEEGATMVRVGTAIFGERKKK